MFEAFLHGLTSVFTWPSFPLMMLGILIGFIIGILPGISAPTTLALMLPFTFHMQPVEAFAFLLGMLTVSVMFGDITSILFGVPGEPLSAAVVLDGHAMAKNGETGRAMGAVLTASLIGAVVGAVVLAASVPIIRPIVLSFASPEFFGLTLLGIAFVAALSEGQMTKGLVAGAFGLLLSMVGRDPQSGTLRYTLGQLDLWEGVGLVPVTVGLFGLGELVDLWIKQKSISEKRVGKIGGLWQGCRDALTHWGLTLRCSLIGTFLGIIPGVGGVGQWVTYAHAVQSADDTSRFGKGDVRGVIGPGAAMNAKEGGNLVTTVAFGVPASISTAILLGAFLIQGIVPGPQMLTTKVDLTFSFVSVLVVSHVISVAACFLLINQMVKITDIRSSLILPGMVLLVLFGGFSERNSLFDMGVTLVAGFVGMAMVYLDWPRPPLILGLVLGRLAENNLFISYQRYGFSFLERPVLIVVMIVAVVLLVLPLVKARLGRRPAPPETSWLQKRCDLVFSGVILILAVWMFWAARDWVFLARLFPWAVGLPAVILALLQFTYATRSLLRARQAAPMTPSLAVQPGYAAVNFPAGAVGSAGMERSPVGETAQGGPAADSPAADEDELAPALVRRRALEMSGWVLLFTVGILLLGFKISAALSTLAFLRIAAHEKWKTALLISLGTFLCFYLAFDRALSIPFPPGWIADALGLNSFESYIFDPIMKLIAGL